MLQRLCCRSAHKNTQIVLPHKVNCTDINQWFMNIFLCELVRLFLSPGFCFSGADFSLERKSSLRPLYLDLCPYMEKCGVIVQIVWRVIYSLIFINIISCRSIFLFLSFHMFKLLLSGRCYRCCLLNMLPPQRQFFPPRCHSDERWNNPLLFMYVCVCVCTYINTHISFTAWREKSEPESNSLFVCTNLAK